MGAQTIAGSSSGRPCWRSNLRIHCRSTGRGLTGASWSIVVAVDTLLSFSVMLVSEYNDVIFDCAFLKGSRRRSNRLNIKKCLESVTRKGKMNGRVCKGAVVKVAVTHEYDALKFSKWPLTSSHARILRRSAGVNKKMGVLKIPLAYLHHGAVVGRTTRTFLFLAQSSIHTTKLQHITQRGSHHHCRARQNKTQFG